MVSCGVKGTAFFIDEDHAITAKHCVEKNLSSGEDIILFFYDEFRTSRSTHAKIVDFDDNLDIALLKLHNPVSHIQDWIEVCNDLVAQGDNWETVGYPEDWNEAEEGTGHCYINGDIHYIDNFEGKTLYDIHLHSELIKEDWPYSLGGLSGSPLIVNGKITGFITREENSVIKSQLKAVSFSKAESFLVKNKTQINSSYISNHYLINGRMKKQKLNCNNLFQRIETPLLNQNSSLSIDSYYLKYSEQGESKISELAKYLAEALNQYVCELSEIKELTIEPTKLNEIYRKTKIAVQEIYKKGKLGSIILWMILEGVLETPKFFKRISLSSSSEDFGEVHIGMRNSKLLFYLGEGKLANDFKECVKVSIKQLEDFGDFKEDIFTSDEEMYKD
ncbi:Hachiman antiphage defense system protein HamA [Paenibacillus sp. USHLN196]|uniref:Hachiman antiphage defense system protein HamA n=1 Tax=Paenibacillus sp. USHLN196 TaxID=3081291 RepID=UPI003019C0C3